MAIDAVVGQLTLVGRVAEVVRMERGVLSTEVVHNLPVLRVRIDGIDYVCYYAEVPCNLPTGGTIEVISE